ncbi:MAG: hypothetical protein KDK91_06865 [Gammaproteobacteria bacterium]|nr:hypothetical protein [Gammaproteobacteria bacterium]
MSGSYAKPAKNAVKNMLAMLYGDEVEVADSADFDSGENTITAVYVSDDAKPVALVKCDVPFGAYAGAALSMIPAAGAKDAAEEGELSKMMLDNLHEVMNILSRVFLSDSTPHLRLGTMYKSLGELPGDARELGEQCGTQVHFQVEIPQYGSGKLSMAF